MFTRFSVPTPFQIGPVNAYVAGRTVVDPGPDSDEAWAALLAGLEELSLAPGDVERVLVTHPHPDHFGVAHRLQGEGADVLASPAAADVVRDFPAHLAHEQSFFTDFFERCGMGRETAETVTQLPEAFLAYAASVDVDRTLEAGDEVSVDGERLTVDVGAGHAPEELLFVRESEDGRIGFVGDHVLPDVTPSPFLQPPTDSDDARPRMLPAYNESLARLREQSFDRFLPGHGDPIESPHERIDAILAAHDERTEAVAELLDGPTTPLDVMNGLFEDLPATDQFGGMSEAVGHLDVLEASGRVTKRERGGLLVYERT